MTAKEIMTTDVVTVKPNTPVPDVARIIATQGISGLPVIDDEDCIVGIVTEDNLLLKHDKVEAPHRLALFGFWVVPEAPLVEAYKNARGNATARDVMTSDVVTFEEADDVGKIAETMVRRRINRVPIVRDCKLVGIVTRGDILRAIAGI